MAWIDWLKPLDSSQGGKKANVSYLITFRAALTFAYTFFAVLKWWEIWSKWGKGKGGDERGGDSRMIPLPYPDSLLFSFPFSLSDSHCKPFMAYKKKSLLCFCCNQKVHICSWRKDKIKAQGECFAQTEEEKARKTYKVWLCNFPK